MRCDMCDTGHVPTGRFLRVEGTERQWDIHNAGQTNDTRHSTLDTRQGHSHHTHSTVHTYVHTYSQPHTTTAHHAAQPAETVRRVPSRQHTHSPPSAARRLHNVHQPLTHTRTH